MDTLFVVKTVDVNYAPIDPKSVDGWFSPKRDATFERKDIRPMTRIAKGTFTLGPVDALEFDCFVSQPETEDFHQPMIFRPEPKPERWEFRGFPEFPSRNCTTHSRDGGGLTCEIVLVVSSMRVIDNDVERLRQTFQKSQPNASIHRNQPFDANVRVFGKTILSGGGTGEDRFNLRRQLVRAAEMVKVRYIGSNGYPKLFICYDNVKKAQARGNKPEDKRRPINYHLFLHPSTGHFGAEPYPFGERYIDMASRYVLIEGATFIGHGVAAQHHAANPQNTISVFPVGAAGKMFNGLNTQASVLRTIQELHWALQRADGDRFPQQPIGGVAISAFSSSIDYIANILGDGVSGVMTQRGILREVYSFDGFHGQGSDAQTRAFCNSLVRFVRADPAKRSFRAYSKSSVYRDILSTALPGAAVTNGAAGSQQFEHDSFTMLFVPLPFWSFIKIIVPDKSLDAHAHQTIPAFFMQHARSVSKLV